MEIKKESAAVIWVTVIAFMVVLVMYLPKHDQIILLFACTLIAAATGFITGRYCDTRRRT